MPYFHATWQRHMPSILKHGLGGALPDSQNFPVESGVYLAIDPEIAISILIEAYCNSDEATALPPPEALAAMRVIVIDDSRVNLDLFAVDPNVERTDVTFLYRGVIDVTSMTVLNVDDIIRAGQNGI